MYRAIEPNVLFKSTLLREMAKNRKAEPTARSQYLLLLRHLIRMHSKRPVCPLSILINQADFPKTKGKVCLLRDDISGYKQYEIVLNDMLYMFDEDNLPAEIKSRLGLIKLSDMPYPNPRAAHVPIDTIFVEMPEWLRDHPHMAEVGWRVDYHHYALVLPTVVIKNLKRRLDKADEEEKANDTRETCQVEGQENP